MTTPYIIYALPRSRTAWLAEFLSYGEWRCYHEQALCMRNINDVRNFFSVPCMGSIETGVAQGRRIIKYHIPTIKEVVILRPVEEVVESMLNADVSGVAVYDRDILQRNMEYGDRVLRNIAKDKNVLAINYNDLAKKETCAKIFEFCLPYKFDEEWWNDLIEQNIQVDIKQVLKYYFDNKEAVDEFKRYCKSELRRLFRLGLVSPERKVCHAIS